MSSPQGDILFSRIGYSFREPSRFLQSVTHKSFVNEHKSQAPEHNERMEFLGDAVLDFVITDLIMERFTALSEGDLSKIRASLVSEATLAEVAREIGLGKYLRMGKGEDRSGGREKNSILSDALEALIAAIYMDSRETEGVAAVFASIARLFGDRIAHVRSAQKVFDFKTELQEIVQKRHKERVNYKIVAEEGPDHAKVYEVAVYIKEREFGRGRGRSKKESEQEAARIALDALAVQEKSRV